MNKRIVLLLFASISVLVLASGCLNPPNSIVPSGSMLSVECEESILASEQVTLKPIWDGGDFVDVYVDFDEGKGWEHLGNELPDEIHYKYYTPGIYNGRMRVVGSNGIDHDSSFDVVVSLKEVVDSWRWTVDFLIYVFIGNQAPSLVTDSTDFTVPQGETVTIALFAKENQSPLRWPYTPQSCSILPEDRAGTKGVISLEVHVEFPHELKRLSFKSDEGEVDLECPVVSFVASELGLYTVRCSGLSNIQGSSVGNETFTFRVVSCPNCGEL